MIRCQPPVIEQSIKVFAVAGIQSRPPILHLEYQDLTIGVGRLNRDQYPWDAPLLRGEGHVPYLNVPDWIFVHPC